MQSTEKWLPVVGYEGVYEVSDQGRVRSLDRTDARGHRIRGRMLRLVSQAATGPDSRQTVSIHWGGVQRTRLVHHLVLEAFVSPRPDGLEACHGDGDARNNAVSNLRWGTHKSNEADKLRHGTHPKVNITHCPRGHELAEPNIVAGEAARGHRKCRACNIATAHAYYRGEPFDTDRADAAFADVMAGRVGLKNEACPRGHLLSGANLVPSDLELGKRGCLACNRTRSLPKSRRLGFDPSVADEKYRQIMEV